MASLNLTSNKEWPVSKLLLPRRQLLKGAAALAAYSALPKAEARTIPTTFFGNVAPFCSGSAYSAPTTLYSANYINSGTYTYTAGASAGALVVVLAAQQETTGSKFISAFTDSVGNSYKRAVQTAGTAGYYCSEIWWTKVTKAIIATTTTFTLTTAGHQVLSVYATSGGNAAPDKTANNEFASATSYSLSTSALACANEILFSVVSPTTNASYLASGPGFTATDANGYTYYDIVASTSAVTFAPTSTGHSQTVTICLASFR